MILRSIDAVFFLLPRGEGADRRMRGTVAGDSPSSVPLNRRLRRHPLPEGEGRIARLLFTLLLLLTPLAASAHEGHDHGEAKVAAPAAGSPRFEAVGDAITVVGIAKGHVLTIYLDRLETNEPVEGAEVVVTHDGRALTAEAKGDGVYTIDAAWVDTPGSRDLTIAVTAGDIADLLPGSLEIPEPVRAETGGMPVTWQSMLASRHGLIALGLAFAVGFVLALAIPRGRRVAAAAALAMLALPWPDAIAHEGHDHGAAPAAIAGDAPRRLPDGSVFVPKPSQRLIGVRTAVAKTEALARVQELIGTVVADPAASGKVQSTMAGRIDMPNGGGIPYVGQRVARGDVLATIVPTVSLVDRGGLAGQIAELSGSIQVAEQRLRRLRQLEGSVPQREIDEAQAELNALRQRRAAVSPTLAEREQLRAPVGGVIAVAGVQAGQVVDAREILFEIVDPAKVWVEAIAFDPRLAEDIGAATALLDPGTGVPLTFLGRSPALRQQAVPLLFRAERVEAGLAIGRPVAVLVESRRKLPGIALPQDAVVRAANGLPQVFEHVSPELFRPVPVRLEPLDARRVLVAAGLEAGQRIVVTGAELLNQVR